MSERKGAMKRRREKAKKPQARWAVRPALLAKTRSVMSHFRQEGW